MALFLLFTVYNRFSVYSGILYVPRKNKYPSRSPRALRKMYFKMKLLILAPPHRLSAFYLTLLSPGTWLFFWRPPWELFCDATPGASGKRTSFLGGFCHKYLFSIVAPLSPGFGRIETNRNVYFRHPLKLKTFPAV